MTNLAERLTQAERDQSSPNTRPKDAASLILIDRSGKQPRVLMGLRHPGHRFMPNVFVFPGGRVELTDKAMPVHGMLDADSERRIQSLVTRPTLTLGRALASAAIRELFEETGLMVGTPDAGAPEIPADSWKAFAEQEVFPDLESLTFVFRAITPPRRPKRFDTRFFAADAGAVCKQIEGMVGPSSELIETRWLTFAETEKAELPTITRVILEELRARLDAGFGRHLPVPFYSMQRGRFVRVALD
ncbi:NUDIX hydrolase [Aquabacter cavernae]|uniref:NUDIX hydrolase n=1 Tax=Aquabacter cavernae TaxID=2496029 RepID=UPI000F8E1ACE|nr:NUDIX hydrolase [Aquabacter cavernae]